MINFLSKLNLLEEAGFPNELSSYYKTYNLFQDRTLSQNQKLTAYLIRHLFEMLYVFILVTESMQTIFSQYVLYSLYPYNNTYNFLSSLYYELNCMNLLFLFLCL